MVDVVAIGLVAGGAVLLFSGAALSVYGAGLLGALLGGGGGYLIAPTITGAVGVSGPGGLAVAILVGAVIGIAITYLLLSVAIASMAFVVGIYIGAVAVAPLVGDGSLPIMILVGLGTGVALAALGMFFTRTTMVLISSFIGATLVSRSLTVDGITTAADNFPNLDSIVFDVTAPLFLGLFGLGVLSQFGLFKLGWVAKIVTYLPGAILLEDNKKRD
jgi:hypothetical protein